MNQRHVVEDFPHVSPPLGVTNQPADIAIMVRSQDLFPFPSTSKRNHISEGHVTMPWKSSPWNSLDSPDPQVIRMHPWDWSVYLPTWMVNLYGKCRYIYHTWIYMDGRGDTKVGSAKNRMFWSRKHFGSVILTVRKNVPWKMFDLWYGPGRCF